MSRAVPYLSLPGITPATVAESVTAADIAAATWAYATRTLTQGATSVAAAVVGDEITVYRGTTWVIALTGLGDLSNYDTVYFSVKQSVYDGEDDAILRVKNDASGLERLQKAAPTAATNGTISVDDAGNGNITVTIQEEETQNAGIRDGLTYDVKGVDNDGQVDLISIGTKKFNIKGVATEAIT